MSNNITTEIVAWAKKNGIKINEEIMETAPEDDKYEFNYSLVNALKDSGSGNWRSAYEGVHPEGFLGDLIQGILSTVTDKEISLVSFSSDDGWLTAKIVLKTDGKETDINIGNVGGEDPDYAPEEIYPALEAFVKQHCSNQLKGIFSEGGIFYLYLTEEQISEFNEIISKIPEPDYL